LYSLALFGLGTTCLAVVPPSTATPLEQALQGILNEVGASDIDVTTCVSDLHDTEKDISSAVIKFRAHATGEALTLLGSAVHSLSVAVTPCQVAELPSRLDQLAAALHLSNVQWVDNALKVWLAGASAEQKIEALISDWESENYAAFGNDLNSLLQQLSSMLNCKPDDKACVVLQSILTKTSKIVSDFTPCVAALTPLAADLENAYTAYEAGNLVDTVKDLAAFAKGMGDAVAPCHLRDLDNLLSLSSDKLKNPSITSSGAITVGPIDITKDIIDLMNSWKAGNYPQGKIKLLTPLLLFTNWF
jgi:hypothetical protein